ncbi:hypothetical protein Q8A67_020098 [Cirrhinus molitorella]|uniref:Uncharacterized protein n=1 Tax=Cirrhinus molitorella TaxID=172907 RepID=A0AA88P896_9TELE|nr:hypothetical protein Q8A67_020098 [Cirrhinus molitorella]
MESPQLKNDAQHSLHSLHLLSGGSVSETLKDLSVCLLTSCYFCSVSYATNEEKRHSRRRQPGDGGQRLQRERRIGGEHPQELLSADAYVCLYENTLYRRTTDRSAGLGQAELFVECEGFGKRGAFHFCFLNEP